MGQETPHIVKNNYTINISEKKKKRPDYADVDGDGDRDEPMAKAFKDKENVEEGKASKFLGALGIAAGLLAVGQMNKSDSVLKAIDAKIEQADTPAEKAALKKLADQRLVFLDTGKGPGGDIKVSDINDKLNESHSGNPNDKYIVRPCKNEKEPWAVWEGETRVKGFVNKAEAKKYADKQNKKQELKEIAEACYRKGMDRNRIAEVLKRYQNKLNEQEDTQLALPEPPARDYLGDDGKDYEGGMAKSQMLKMKKYAAALCDMIDDESQLESWVQAKLTKASEYMSAVYHYLDYQNSKMDNGQIN